MSTIAGFSAYQTFQARGGTKYTADATGNIVGVTDVNDLRDMILATGRVLDTTAIPAANGLFLTRIPLINGKNADATTLAATASSGKFGLSMIAGTSEILVSEAASANVKTDTVVFEQQLPRNYVAGQNLTLTANANYTVGAGTVSGHSVAVHLYKAADAGTQTSDAVATSAQNTGTAAGDLAFVVTGTSLSPLDRVVISLVSVIGDSAGAAITQQINSIRMS